MAGRKNPDSPRATGSGAKSWAQGPSKKWGSLAKANRLRNICKQYVKEEVNYYNQIQAMKEPGWAHVNFGENRLSEKLNARFGDKTPSLKDKYHFLNDLRNKAKEERDNFRATQDVDRPAPVATDGKKKEKR